MKREDRSHCSDLLGDSVLIGLFWSRMYSLMWIIPPAAHKIKSPLSKHSVWLNTNSELIKFHKFLLSYYQDRSQDASHRQYGLTFIPFSDQTSWESNWGFTAVAIDYFVDKYIAPLQPANLNVLRRLQGRPSSRSFWLVRFARLAEMLSHFLVISSSLSSQEKW